jgi:hypothetical protein
MQYRIVLSFFLIFLAIFNTMIRLVEGTHYMRREEQPTHTPPKSKKVFECLLRSDPGDDDDAQVGHGRRKRSRPVGLNIAMKES